MLENLISCAKKLGKKIENKIREVQKNSQEKGNFLKKKYNFFEKSIFIKFIS